MERKKPVQKLDMLEWIMKRRRVWPYELIDHFGFTPGYASVLLYRLKRARLITNMGRGCPFTLLSIPAIPQKPQRIKMLALAWRWAHA